MNNGRFGKIKVIIRWGKMLCGKSVFHMSQKEGKYYKKDVIRGYYSDLRHKVTGAELIDENGVPFNRTSEEEDIYFPTTIFQYGLGAYDLYLETGDEIFREKFFCSVNWALSNQNPDGSWNAFGWDWMEKANPYSSMTQGEGASLLCRAYAETGDIKYVQKAELAVKFMLKPVSEGGTAIYQKGMITLEEMSSARTVLNGMMFSVWGLYDVCLITENSLLHRRLKQIEISLEKLLKYYDRGYWSNYNLNGSITSPFYHELHIEQLKVMYQLFEKPIYKETYKRWQKYQESFLKSKFSFFIKAAQKIKTINQDVVLVK